jgi:hypothetical protein
MMCYLSMLSLCSNETVHMNTINSISQKNVHELKTSIPSPKTTKLTKIEKIFELKNTNSWRKFSCHEKVEFCTFSYLNIPTEQMITQSGIESSCLDNQNLIKRNANVSTSSEKD